MGNSTAQKEEAAVRNMIREMVRRIGRSPSGEEGMAQVRALFEEKWHYV